MVQHLVRSYNSMATQTHAYVELAIFGWDNISKQHVTNKLPTVKLVPDHLHLRLTEWLNEPIVEGLFAVHQPILDGGVGLKRFVHVVHYASIDNGHVGVGLLDGGEENLVHVGVDVVVTVDEADVAPLGHRQAGVAGTGEALILLMYDFETWVAGGELVADGAGAVGRAVINDNALPVGEGLVGNALEALAHVSLYVIDGHDDTYGWIH